MKSSSSSFLSMLYVLLLLTLLVLPRAWAKAPRRGPQCVTHRESGSFSLSSCQSRLATLALKRPATWAWLYNGGGVLGLKVLSKEDLTVPPARVDSLTSV